MKTYIFKQKNQPDMVMEFDTWNLAHRHSQKLFDENKTKVKFIMISFPMNHTFSLDKSK